MNMTLLCLLLIGRSPVPLPTTFSEESSKLTTLFDYQIGSTQRTQIGTGRTTVSIDVGGPAPTTGYYPARFFIDNSKGPTQSIRLSAANNIGSENTSAKTTVEIRAGERRVVTLPVSTDLRYGIATASGVGITEGGSAPIHSAQVYGDKRAVISLSSAEAFQQFVGKEPNYSDGQIQVLLIPPDEAPADMTAYVGWAAVVIPKEGTFESLNEAQRQALENYAAVGGTLILPNKLRIPLPLPHRDSVYGFGHVFETNDIGSIFLSDENTVKPVGALPEWKQKQNPELLPLLPQATAPLGKFFLIIFFFTLLIGPGSYFVAQARGQAALLVTIPLTAFVTCAAILGYSSFADGFTVHSAHYGFTQLTREGTGSNVQRRALSLSLSAWYANLAPGPITLPQHTVPIQPEDVSGTNMSVGLEFTDGLKMTSFLNSRTYREWGFSSVESTRARVSVANQNNEFVLSNALGFDIKDIAVNIDGVTYMATRIKDGQTGILKRGAQPRFVMPADTRFADHIRNSMLSELTLGEFLARLDDRGFLASADIRATNQESINIVRGMVEP
jgi:hypothetical protein